MHAARLPMPATYEFLTNKHAHVMRVAPQLIWESEE